MKIKCARTKTPRRRAASGSAWSRAAAGVAAPGLVWFEPGLSPANHPPGHHAGPVHGDADAPGRGRARADPARFDPTHEQRSQYDGFPAATDAPGRFD